MKKPTAFSDRVAQSAAIAEAINSIALCVEISGIPVKDERVASAIFLGIEKLGEVLINELSDIAEDLYETENTKV